LWFQGTEMDQKALERFADAIAEAGITKNEPFDVVLVMKLIMIFDASREKITDSKR
jgi:hypothetical protein